MISHDVQVILTNLILGGVVVFFGWKFFLFAAAPRVSRWLLGHGKVKAAMWLRAQCACD